MEVMTLRMDEADIKTLDGLCEERAKSRSEILRVVVKRGLKEEAGPDPQPMPPGSWGTTTPQPLPDLLHGVQQGLDVWKDRLVGVRTAQFTSFAGPKFLAAAGTAAAALALYPAPIFWAPVAAEAAMIFDWYRTGPGLRLAIINRAISDLVNLSDDIPRLWAQACLTMSPAQAELHVLEIVKARRDAIGAACLKDLGENFWEPEGN